MEKYKTVLLVVMAVSAVVIAVNSFKLYIFPDWLVLVLAVLMLIASIIVLNNELKNKKR